MSDFKTLAYDLYKLRANDRPLVMGNLPDILSLRTLPTVTITRENFTDFSNNYKLLAEFASEVLGNVQFTTWDLVEWYRAKAAKLEYKARTVWNEND